MSHRTKPPDSGGQQRRHDGQGDGFAQQKGLQSQLIQAVKASAVRVGIGLCHRLRLRLKQPPLNEHRGNGQRREPAQHERNQQYLEQRFTIFPGRVLRQPNRRKGKNRNHRGPQQRQGRTANHIINCRKSRRSLLAGDQHAFDDNDSVIDQHAQGDNQCPQRNTLQLDPPQIHNQQRAEYVERQRQGDNNTAAYAHKDQ